MTKTTTTTELPAEVPAFLRRTNEKGVTLSAGIDTSAAKTAPKAPKAAKEAKAPKTPKAAKEAKAPKAPKTAKPKAAKANPAPATEEQPAVRRSIVPKKFKDAYAKHNGTCGDDMALELKAATTKLNEDKRETLDIPALRAVAAQNGLEGTLDGYIAKALNNGQLRMNIGNKLRGMLKAGKDVTIGAGKSKRVFKAEDYDAA